MKCHHRIILFAAIALFVACAIHAPTGWAASGTADLSGEPPVIRADLPWAAPEWALLERRLIETMNRAGEEFVKTYVLPDGSLRWKERYEGGMNSSDDAYEGFRGYSLHYILGGAKNLDTLHRHIWEGITRQFTRYGQIYREFDSNWDWMHHGEGYVSFYPLGMADPYDERFRQRAIRFAEMYTGDDPEAPNYNRELKLMRASMTGSRGPKMEWSKRDWIPTNANLVYYHLPFDDIPGVESSTGWINDHPEDDQFQRIVQVMSDRMARGDVPINLTAAPLVANAYLYTGDEKYRRWVTEYLGKWIELTKQNGGITPDNVGLSGKIGEYNNGNWWGGYYGWQWVRGGTDIVMAAATAAKVALLLTGESEWFRLPRGQLAVLRERGKVEDGRPLVPIRYNAKKGWHHYVAEPAMTYVHMWFLSQEDEDWRQVERLAELQRRKGELSDQDLGWAYYLKGRNDRFPAQAFRRDLRFVATKLKRILNEHGDPETWYDAQWLVLEPMPTDNLIRLTTGGLPVHKRGEMLHAYLRYFDPVRKVAGLPRDVAALVTGVADDYVDLELVNTNLFEARRITIQGGAYGEHTVTEVRYSCAQEEQPVGARVANRLISEERTVGVDAVLFDAELEPGAGTTLRIGLRRYANQPRYALPWGEAGQ